jgi:hypothetical protein
MSKSKKFSDITERIEYLRNLLNLNKSRFSSDIGMKPQTYNNFIGAQGSKPNVELIYGIVNKFGASPMWLLNGTGPIFLDEAKSADYLGKSPTYRGEVGALAGVHEPREGFAPQPSQEELDAIRSELRALEPVLRTAESQLNQVEGTRLNVLERCVGLLRRYYGVAPAVTIAEARAMLERIEQRLIRPD